MSLFDVLKNYLSTKRMLLVLDNFEHVIAASPVVTELLAVSPDLKLMVTSRVALRVYGEHEYPVESLPVPDGRESLSIESLLKYPSISLFVARAMSHSPGFALTESNALAVVRICGHLDGLPLAIELAAARTKVFRPEDLQPRVERHVLAELVEGPRDMPPKHRTLRATIAWSYDLLDPEERRLFWRLAVFLGGCRVDAAEAVCNGDTDRRVDVVQGLRSLIDKSLVRSVTDANGHQRFVMLETIREFAMEKLEASGEADTVRKRYASYYLAIAERDGPELNGPRQKELLDYFSVEHDNIRAILRGALDDREADTALRLIAAVWWFWWVYDYLSEGRRWMEEALAISEDSVSRARVTVLQGAGSMARAQAHYESATELLRQSLSLAGGLSDKRGMAYALQSLGGVLRDLGRYSEAMALYDESLALRRAISDKRGIADSLYVMALATYHQDALPKAKELARESLELYRETGGQMNLGDALRVLADIARDEGDQTRAVELYSESLRLFQEIHDQRGIIYCLEGLAGVRWATGEVSKAVTLLAAAEALHGAIGAPRKVHENTFYDRIRAGGRSEVDEESFLEAERRGRAMSVHEAVALALS